MLGLCGGHRVGKSTLAKEYAKKHNWTFLETSVSSVFEKLGHKPNEKFDFETRLTIQEQILIHLARLYREGEGYNVITDRTPIDMLAYTMSEAVGDVVKPELQPRLTSYVNKCFELTNNHFAGILVVQPGIPLVVEEGKAAINAAYIDHLNALVIGLCSDERMKTPHYYIPKARTDMEERLKCVSVANQRTFDLAAMQIGQLDRASFH